MFNLEVPHVCLLLANMGSRSKRKSVPMGSRVVIVVESHFSQKTREMGHPKVLTFHPVRNR
jgi:hypothetical protein